MSKKSTSIYIDENIMYDIRKYINESNNFNSISELIEYLFSNLISGKFNTTNGNELLISSNFENILANLNEDNVDLNNKINILLQIISTMAKDNGTLLDDHYEDIFQYKKSKEILGERKFNIPKNNGDKKIDYMNDDFSF